MINNNAMIIIMKTKDIFNLEEEYQTPFKENDRTVIFRYKFVISLNNTLPYNVPNLDLTYE